MAEEVTSQPSDARGIVAKHLADYAPEPETPQAPEVEAAPAPEEFDPATIRIPNQKFVTNVPKALEKFKDKTLVDLATSYEEAERAMHTKAEEAARYHRENDELKARLAAAEQYARMTPAQPTVQTDPYTQRGIKLDEAIITDPRSVMATTLDEARRIAREEAEKAANASGEKSRAEFQQAENARRLIGALESARMEASKLYGAEIPIEQWREDVMYIAPRVKWENDNGSEGRIYDPRAYVDHYTRLKGAPKASVPTEGNPPVAARPANVRSERAAPTLTREEALIRKQIRGALNLKD